jgi:hypothetical protein
VFVKDSKGEGSPRLEIMSLEAPTCRGGVAVAFDGRVIQGGRGRPVTWRATARLVPTDRKANPGIRIYKVALSAFREERGLAFDLARAPKGVSFDASPPSGVYLTCRLKDRVTRGYLTTD